MSLINLMDTIGQTNVHYIRCIKPNEAKVAWEFEPNMVLAQLRACGVLETIRISCAGYPSRWTFEDFADRYGVQLVLKSDSQSDSTFSNFARYYALVSSEYWDPNKNPDIKQLCKVILHKYITDADKYQIGLTKIFFRAGQLAYMEKLRADRWNECVVLLQKNMRRFIVRLRYVRMKDLATRLQQVARRKVAIRKIDLLKKEQAVLAIQKYWRGYLARKRMEERRMFAVRLQAAARGFLARKSFGHSRENNAALQIQALVRGW